MSSPSSSSSDGRSASSSQEGLDLEDDVRSAAAGRFLTTANDEVLLGVFGLRLLVTFFSLVLEGLGLLDLPRALPLPPLPRPRPAGRLLLRLGAIAQVGVLRLQPKCWDLST